MQPTMQVAQNSRRCSLTYKSGSDAVHLQPHAGACVPRSHWADSAPGRNSPRNLALIPLLVLQRNAHIVLTSAALAYEIRYICTAQYIRPR